MKQITTLSAEQALHKALVFAGIENEAFDLTLERYEDGLYHFVVRTFWIRYEFYVEAGAGEVLGIQTEPIDHHEDRGQPEPAENALFAVA